MSAFLRNGFAHVDNVNCYSRDQSNHMATPVKVARQQTTPELSGTFQNPPIPTPAHPGTLRNFPEPSKTFRNLPPEPTPAYTEIVRNRPEPSGTCLRNRHHFLAELSRTFRNLPPAISGTHRNSPEPSGTFQHLSEPTPAYTGTFRNLPPESTPFYGGTLRNLPEPASTTYTSICRNPPEPTPAHTGTLRNLPEPSSGICSYDPHRHTPELIWAEDPNSLHCWGKIYIKKIKNI